MWISTSLQNKVMQVQADLQRYCMGVSLTKELIVNSDRRHSFQRGIQIDSSSLLLDFVPTLNVIIHIIHCCGWQELFTSLYLHYNQTIVLSIRCIFQLRLNNIRPTSSNWAVTQYNQIQMCKPVFTPNANYKANAKTRIDANSWLAMPIGRCDRL